ncbi:uncharacterized protein LOC144610841 [Rhinoraja longicauda]
MIIPDWLHKGKPLDDLNAPVREEESIDESQDETLTDAQLEEVPTNGPPEEAAPPSELTLSIMEMKDVQHQYEGLLNDQEAKSRLLVEGLQCPYISTEKRQQLAKELQVLQQVHEETRITLIDVMEQMVRMAERHEVEQIQQKEQQAQAQAQAQAQPRQAAKPTGACPKRRIQRKCRKSTKEMFKAFPGYGNLEELIAKGIYEPGKNPPCPPRPKTPEPIRFVIPVVEQPTVSGFHAGALREYIQEPDYYALAEPEPDPVPGPPICYVPEDEMAKYFVHKKRPQLPRRIVERMEEDAAEAAQRERQRTQPPRRPPPPPQPRLIPIRQMEDRYEPRPRFHGTQIRSRTECDASQKIPYPHVQSKLEYFGPEGGETNYKCPLLNIQETFMVNDAVEDMVENVLDDVLDDFVESACAMPAEELNKPYLSEEEVEQYNERIGQGGLHFDFTDYQTKGQVDKLMGQMQDDEEQQNLNQFQLQRMMGRMKEIEDQDVCGQNRLRKLEEDQRFPDLPASLRKDIARKIAEIQEQHQRNIHEVTKLERALRKFQPPIPEDDPGESKYQNMLQSPVFAKPKRSELPICTLE